MGVQSSVDLLWFSVLSVCCSTAGGRCGPGSVTTQSQFMVGKTQQYWSCAGRLQLHHGSLKTGRAICRAGPTQSHDSLLPPPSSLFTPFVSFCSRHSFSLRFTGFT